MTPKVTSVTVPSGTTSGLYYVVSRINGFARCTCPGFAHRGRCKHLVFAPAAEAWCELCRVEHRSCCCPKLQTHCPACRTW